MALLSYGGRAVSRVSIRQFSVSLAHYSDKKRVTPAKTAEEVSNELSSALKFASNLKITRSELETTETHAELKIKKKSYVHELDKMINHPVSAGKSNKNAKRSQKKQPPFPLSPRQRFEEISGEIPAELAGPRWKIKPRIDQNPSKSSENKKSKSSNAKENHEIGSTRTHLKQSTRKYSTHSQKSSGKSKNDAPIVSNQRKANSLFNDIENQSVIITANGHLRQINITDKTALPRLAHNLDRVLFSPGHHYLQDPRTNVYNFSPYLKEIMSVDEFDFSKINQFVISSKDATLLEVARKTGSRYYSSTSSMTGALSQMHFFLSQGRRLNIMELSKWFPGDSARFSFGASLASVVIVKPQGKKNNVFSIDTDKTTDNEVILSLLGHSMEKLLTTDELYYENYRHENSHKLTVEDLTKPEHYNYAQYGKFLMRSQLDCYDPRLPGNGTFDLKTRAVCAVRHDIDSVEMNPTHYQIDKTHGLFESFDREDYELATSAMLKYSLQARIGQMDGIFVAYHNIQNLFGFRYFPLKQIDNLIHGGDPKTTEKLNLHNINSFAYQENEDVANFIADTEFKMSIKLWEDILEKVMNKLGNVQPFRLCIKSNKVKKTDGTNNQEHVLDVIAVRLSEEHLEDCDLLAEKTISRRHDVEDKKQFLAGKRRRFNELMHRSLRDESSVFGLRCRVNHFVDGVEVVAGESPVLKSVSADWNIKIDYETLPVWLSKKLFFEQIGEKARLAFDVANEESQYITTLRKISKNREDAKKKGKPQEIVVYEPKYYNSMKDGKLLRE